MALGRLAELAALEREVGDLAERLEARKIIDRAKGRLMDEHGLTEQEAWRFLQTAGDAQPVDARVARVIDASRRASTAGAHASRAERP